MERIQSILQTTIEAGLATVALFFVWQLFYFLHMHSNHEAISDPFIWFMNIVELSFESGVEVSSISSACWHIVTKIHSCSYKRVSTMPELGKYNSRPNCVCVPCYGCGVHTSIASYYFFCCFYQGFVLHIDMNFGSAIITWNERKRMQVASMLVLGSSFGH